MNGKLLGQFAAFALAALLAGAGAAAERVYKWVDSSGGVHYGRQAPPGIKAELITVQAVFSAPIEDEAPARTAAKENSADQPDFCANAKKNIDILNGTGPVTRPDDKGQPHVLTPEERKAELERSHKAMDLYCQDQAAAKK